MHKYSIGVDFGTLSGRALLVDAADGRELADAVYEYPHGVMDRALPSGRRLEPDWALQHPQDYIDVFIHTIPRVLEAAGVSPDDVVGLGVDFTACTLLPVAADGTPLCFLERYKDEPNAYVKLWKHHAAQEHANRLNTLAQTRGEKWLPRYGGKISSEWAFPKALQVFEDARNVYDDADLFVEATDWVVWQLCGRFSRNMCTAGYKAIWNAEEGYPQADFFEALSPGFGGVLRKFHGEPAPLGGLAGGLTKEFATRLGLREGTAVAVANVDAHVTVPALGISGPGKMLAIMGTSTCHMLMGTEEHEVPGMCGVVRGGILPGIYGYEAGQSCVGDHFAWAVDNCVPPSYYERAAEAGMSIHTYLRSLAQKQKPGEHGLVALDWWNGNRSVLVDADLTGLLLGMTLQTKPEDIYRALIEATAYGTRKIIETFEQNGVPVDEFYASGGIAQKDPMMMQIYADVIRKPVRIAESKNGPALGAAIFGAVAAGAAAGGYDDIYAAAAAMGRVRDEIYMPREENAAVYDKLYAEYSILHDYFGRGANDVMKRLKTLKKAGM